MNDDAPTFNNAHDEASAGGDGSGGSDGEEIFEAPSEEKKPANLGAALVFALMVAGAGGMYFFFLRPGPQSAKGAMLDPAAASANATITQFLADGKKNVEMMRQVLGNTEKVVDQFRNYPNAVQVPLTGLKANPFQFASLHFTAETPTDMTRKRKEEERVAALKAVQALQLQSVMRSETHRACMINNRMYQEGQTVEDFSVETITAGTVIVKRGLYRFELKMEK